MNELSKPIHDIGDTVLMTTTYRNIKTGVAEYPTTATVILVKDDVELEREVLSGTALPGEGVAEFYYRVMPETDGGAGPGRYTYRFIGNGPVVSSAEEDWFYVRKSACPDPIE